MIPFARCVLPLALLLGTASALRAEPAPPDWAALRATVPAAQQPAYDFLVAHLPAADRATLDPVIMLETLDLSFRARAEFAWARTVPDEVFLNDVLPYAFVNEARENWRPTLYAKVAPLVRDAPTRLEAIRRINMGIARLTGVKFSTERRQPHQAPGQSMAAQPDGPRVSVPVGTFWLVLGGCGSAVLAAAFPDVGIGLLGVSLGLRSDRADDGGTRSATSRAAT
jgi:hypothetical protein